MSHSDRRALSEKQNVLNICSNNTKAMGKSCSTDFSATCCKSVGRTEDNCSISQKVKRLKTRKERDQIRGQDNSSSHQKHLQGKKRSKEKAQCYSFQDCPCTHSVKHFRKERAGPKPHKPSLITEGRLTSIRGLFSHQVRSVDIERLVKEQNKRHKPKESQPGQDISPQLRSPPPLIPVYKSREGGRYIQGDQKSKKRSRNVPCQQTDQSQINLQDMASVTLYKTDRKLSSDRKTQFRQETFDDAVDDTTRCGSLCCQIQTEPVVLSSSESELVHKTPSSNAKTKHHEPHVTSKTKDILKRHFPEQTNETTSDTYKRHAFVRTQRLDSSPTKSVVLSMAAPQYDSGHPSFTTSSPALDREKITLADEGHHQNPGVVSRLSARLCQTLDFLPLRRHCPLLTECREVLLQTLKERHSSQLQHSLRKLRSHFNAKSPCLPHGTEQACTDSGQKYGDNAHIGFSLAWKNEDSRQDANIESCGDNGSQRKYVGEDFTHSNERGAKWNVPKQAWGTYSPQDFLMKRQMPFQDILGQWSIRAQSEESLRGKQHFNSQGFPMHQGFIGPEILTSSSHNWKELTSDTLYLHSQKEVKLGSSEVRSKDCNELFEQWRNDPDLGFLIHGENMRRPNAPLSHLTELRDWSPQQKPEGSNERSLASASSTVSAFYPPEGFRYKPYYRFPHPFRSINSTERSALYTQAGKESGHSSFLPQSSSHIQYWP